MKKIYWLLLLWPSFVIFGQKIKTDNQYYFSENKGQITDQNLKPNPEVKFLFNSDGFNVQLRKNGFSYDVYETEKTPIKETEKSENAFGNKSENKKFNTNYKFHRVDVELPNSNPNPEIIAEGKSTDYENYYNIPNKPEGITQVYRYQKLTYKNIYPNVDLVFFKPTDSTKTIEYNFIVKPGGKISDIQMKFNGAKTILKNGKISMEMRFGEMQENIPNSWIEHSNKKQTLKVGYKELGNGVFGFNSEINTSNKTIVIDPVPTRIWGTYYGGNGSSFVYVKTDTQGNPYLYGITNATNNIASIGAFQFSYGGGNDDVFVAKLTKDGQRVWGTYYGNQYLEDSGSINFDEDLNIYFVGVEQSYQTYNNIYTLYSNNFLLKLNPQGNKIYLKHYNYSGGFKQMNDLQVKNNDIYIIGETNSLNIATPGTYQDQFPNNINNNSAIISKLDKDTGDLVWSSYFGTSEGANSFIKIIDINNSAIEIIGNSKGKSSIELIDPFQSKINEKVDGIYVKLSSDGKTLIKSSYFGTKDDDVVSYARKFGDSIQVSGCQNLIVGEIGQPTFICKIDLKNNVIKQITSFPYLSNRISYIDNKGNTFFTGDYFYTTKNVSTANAYLTIKKTYPYFFKINNNNILEWSTYYGGDGGSQYMSITTDDNGFIYFSGFVDNSSYGYSTPNTFQQKPYKLALTGYVAKFTDCESKVNLSYSPFCLGNDLQLKADGGETYEWFGPNNFHSTEQNPLIKNAQNINAGEYFVKISGANTCGGIFSLNINVGDPSPPKPDVENLPDIIGNCKTILTAPTATDGCGNVFTAITYDQISNLYAGNYTITWNFDDGNGNKFSQTQKVIIKATEKPTANNTLVFCLKDHPKISDLKISGNELKFYNEYGFLISKDNLLENRKYYVTQTLEGCESEKTEITVILNNTAKPITNKPIQEFCPTQEAKIKDLAVNGINLKFYDENGIVLSDTKLLENNKSYFITQTENNCESDKLEIKVVFNNNAIPANNFETSICNNTTSNTKTENLKIYETQIINGTGYIFEYYDVNKIPINNSSNQTINVGENLFNVKVSTKEGCYKWVTLKIILNPKPILTLPDTVEFCNGNSVILDAGLFNTYLWSTGEKTRKIEVNKAGTYTVTVGNKYNCENSAHILVKESKIASILGVNVVNNTATVIMSNAGDFLFSLDQKNWQSSNVFKDLSNGTYTVYVKNTNGCIIGETNFVIFNVPSTFTPNGDGINDTWTIKGLENYPGSEIKVLDRYGNLVLNTIIKGTFSWDGIFNNRNLPTGNYWYTIKITDGRVLTGWVLLKNRN